MLTPLFGGRNSSDRKKYPSKDINRLRYRYFYSYDFYYFLAFIAGISLAVFMYLTDLLSFSNYLSAYITGCIIAYFTAYFILKLLFSIPKGLYLKIPIISAAAFGITAAVAYIFTFLFWIIFITEYTFALFLYIKTEKIKIYPNRFYVGKKVFYYKDIDYVYWATMELDENLKNLPQKYADRKIHVLTPLHYESSGKDFTIFHHYLIVVMKDGIYVFQSLFWRNSLVQNIRNGWLEKWRWDGTFEPPEDFIRPNPPPYLR